MAASRMLGVPVRLVPAELRREIREVRRRWPVVRAAARGSTIMSRVEVDRGTIMLTRPGAVIMDVTVIGLQPRGACRCGACRHLRGLTAVVIDGGENFSDAPA